MSMRTRLLGVATITAVFAATIAVSATTLLRMEIEDLAGHADLVVIGTVEESTPQWNEDRTLIYTHTYIRVTDVVDGAVKKDDRVHVISVGGTIGDDQMIMAGNPTYEVGETVAVFLEERRKGVNNARVSDHYLMVGLFQGKFRVIEKNGHKIAVRPAMIDGTTILTKDGVAVRPIHQVPLTDLIKRVEKVKGVQP